MSKVTFGHAVRCLMIVFLVLFGCTDKTEEKYYDISVKIIGQSKYNRIYKSILDTINIWSDQNLGYYQYYGKSKDWTLDTLLCFNTSGNRFISCLLEQNKLREAVADAINWLYGEKIDDKWYFFNGPNLFVPRSGYGNASSIPLSFEKLHEIALHEVFSQYIKNDQINEDWFKEHFEGSGWGDFNRQEEMDWVLHGKRFTNRGEYYEFMHLRAALGVWQDKDSTQKTLP